SLENPSPLETSRSVILSFLLTILFLLSFSRPPRGYVETKKLLHTLQTTARKNRLLSEERLDFESFLQILFRLVLKHHCGCLLFRCLYLLPSSNRDRSE